MPKLSKQLVAASIFVSLSAQAAVSPIGLSIVPPLELPPSDFTIAGARVSALFGDNMNVYGVDLGLLGNVTEQNFVGIGLSGAFNYNKGTATVIGLQAAGLTNINMNKANIFGVQAAVGLNSNQAESTLVGLDLALVNYSPYTQVYGFQVGLYNRARVVNGFQLGLVNVADVLHGVQIGLLNFNHQGLFAFSPFLNIGF